MLNYASRQPMTDENFGLHRNSITSRILAGDESLYARARPPVTAPHVTAIARDVAGEMAEHMRETGSGTRDDLRLKFTDAEIDKYGDDARRRFNRSARQVA